MREKKYTFGREFAHVADQYRNSLEKEGWIVKLTLDERGNFLLQATETPKVRQNKQRKS